MNSPTAAEIKALRVKHGLTQAQAARVIGLAPRSWEAFEQGRNQLQPVLWYAFQKRLEDATPA